MTDKPTRESMLTVTGLIGASLNEDVAGIQVLRPPDKAGLSKLLDASVGLTTGLLILAAEQLGCTPQELLDDLIRTFVMDPEEDR